MCIKCENLEDGSIIPVIETYKSIICSECKRTIDEYFNGVPWYRKLIRWFKYQLF